MSGDYAGDQVANNVVLLTGRLSGEPASRVLPSGETLVTWRLVVDRPAAKSPAGQRLPTVDTIDCATFKRGVQRMATRWAPGDVLEVRGALRRRFWRGVNGAASRCEVEVLEVRRLAAQRSRPA